MLLPLRKWHHMKMFAWITAKFINVNHTNVSQVLQCEQFMAVNYVVFIFVKNAQ